MLWYTEKGTVGHGSGSKGCMGELAELYTGCTPVIAYTVTNKGNDPEESSATGSVSPTRKKDTVLEKRSPPDIRGQLQEPKIVIAQYGDTLSKIIIREYGQYDKNSLDLVVKANPDIIDISRLEVGQRITLPKFSKPTTNN